MPSLRRVLDSLGPTLLAVLSSPRGLDVEVTGVELLDPEAIRDSTGAVVVCPSITGTAADVALLHRLEAAGAIGAVIRHSAGTSVEATPLPRLAVLEVPVEVGWMQLASLLQTATSTGLRAGHETIGGLDAGDLFAAADAIAALIDAPVTIEDPDGRVLAFSRGQERGDAARAATILGRQAPGESLDRMRRAGVYRRLVQSHDPIFVRGIPPDIRPRVAVAVRAGAEVLGSVWAVVEAPLPEHLTAAFRDGARLLALHMLRERVGRDGRRRVRNELMEALMEGGRLAADAARRLGVEGRAASGVVAFGVVDPHGEGAAAHLGRMADLLALHAGPLRIPTGVVGDAVYAVVPLGRGEDSRPAVDLGEAVLRRAEPSLRQHVLVGVGGGVSTIHRLPSSRRQAELVVRTLRSTGARGTVSHIDAIAPLAFVESLHDLSDEALDLAAQVARRLEAHDAQSGGTLTATVSAWLRAFGDTEQAARELGVHGNTVRNRIRQVREDGIAALGDPDTRLALQVHLRLRRAVTAAPVTDHSPGPSGE